MIRVTPCVARTTTAQRHRLADGARDVVQPINDTSIAWKSVSCISKHSPSACRGIASTSGRGKRRGRKERLSAHRILLVIEPHHGTLRQHRIGMRDVPKKTGQSRPPLDLSDHPMSHFARSNVPCLPDRTKRRITTTHGTSVSAHVFVNGGHCRSHVINKPTLQTLRLKGGNDSGRVRDEVFMPNNGGAVRSLPRCVATTEVAMSIASPKVNGTGEHAFAEFIFVSVKFDALGQPIPPSAASLQA